MSTELYDAIVVGARCAGSPTAMLLARAGYRVLLIDRATFPSNTVSGHFIHPPGVAALRRWGLLDRLAATGCPSIGKYTFDFGPFALSATPRPTDSVSVAYCPRRTVLDKLLVDAAAEAGAEVREAFTATELVFDGDRVQGLTGHGRDGVTHTEHARVVIGADGRNSFVARSTQAPEYNVQPALAGQYYTYFSGLATDGTEIYVRPEHACVMNPTHEDLTMVAVGWPYPAFTANRRDIAPYFMKSIDAMPTVAERVHAAQQAERFVGMAVTYFFRQPFGPGWALVGDAGHTKDPVTAFGISDAFVDAERCTAALGEWLSGSRSFDTSMGEYQRMRDEYRTPMHELTCGLASFEPPSPELSRLLAASHGNQQAMTDFVSMMAGTLPVPDFFAPSNVERIISAADA